MENNFVHVLKKSVLICVALLMCACGTQSVFAQTNQNGSYVPLIGITSVPDPLALSKGAGMVTYHYAVKNFLSEIALTNVHVVDDTCSPVTFVTGDDNHDNKLDYSETWRYACTLQLSTTTQSIATATGMADTLIATHKAYTTVVVGSNNPAPLVSIVNISKIAYPLSLPKGGGSITFTYKVNNPGVVPLSNVAVTDDKCANMSGHLGDRNGNQLLDTNEVWVYTCTTTLFKSTTNTATVTAYSNSLKAIDYYTLTVMVATTSPSPNFPDTGGVTYTHITVWGILVVIFIILVIYFMLMKKRKPEDGPRFFERKK